MNKCIRILVLISLLTGGCVIVPATETEADTAATAPSQVSSMMPEIPAATQVLASPAVQLAQSDQVVFTIPNPEPFSGQEGEPRPDWLGWGAETFAVAPDGDFWIADTAVYPNRLLRYSAVGKLLRHISLENIVVHAYDLVVTQDSLWVLDISAQPARMIQLGMDGEVQSSINISKEIMTYNGQIISNGIYSLFVGEEGELLVHSVNGYYVMVNAAGQVTARPLDTLHYYGHTFKTGLFNETTGRLPVFVDGTLLEGSLDFFVEVPFLGFNPDGSFALAGIIEDAEHRVNHQVRYYSSSGELLGLARQRPQIFYKDGNHHLAFGPDGSVYQLLSNPDHSVQILRLGFSDQLPPFAEPAITPTPLTILQPSESAATDEDQGRNVLLAFFTNLSNGNYEKAATDYGGDKIEYGRDPLPGETQGDYWKYICNIVLSCLPVADITNTEQVSKNEFIFHVVFVSPDGSRFAVGACCGGDPAASPPVWQFAYSVKKMDGVWKVMRGPIFTP